ncbi:hypothetical protein POSPLADRAFT_1064930 [Postia placenta MAD-698-R-SB12]|uniref:Uncharacterized protein n=1 Tax=Postia placenta MAD-698-R-SB12 TaxID=670580 RepID=A0A1X6N8N9_9APHY|nr:hypothetical protein POSPLADRAFT_1064930 [Postia placenta MAD-698-R-SB12]OSX64816.1 hypothetical protein POSPLADRAFT_1064930 [Postia placenta MAD-698-R-SB12]
MHGLPGYWRVMRIFKRVSSDECLVCASGSIPDSESTDSEGSQSLCEECTDCFKSFVRRRKLQMWEAVQDMIW